MLLFVLAFVGGFLTILSPCILPVLPFVFSRSEKSFFKSSLPLLCGMAFTFALVSSLIVVGGSWAVNANEWGRYIAMFVLALFGFSLIFPSLSEKITEPLSRLGAKINSQSSEKSFGTSFVLGVATGLLWAPCAGPILGLILTGAALKGASLQTSLLLLTYALGAATSLGLALFAGGKILQGMRGYLGFDVWVRRILGVAVLCGVIIVAFGLDRGTLTKLSRLQSDALEQNLVGKLAPPKDATAAGDDTVAEMPELDGAVAWLNSPPLSRNSLRGKVVLIDFWTYSCINCLRSLPYVKAWAEKYKDAGLVVIGVHTPEFAFEKNLDNVKKAVGELGVNYPVAIDNDYLIWQAFDNNYWPAHYFVDINGKIRHRHFGEGNYEESEKFLQQLLQERNGTAPAAGLVDLKVKEGVGAESSGQANSPETYIGTERGERNVSLPELRSGLATDYKFPKKFSLNEWALMGKWNVNEENAQLLRAPGKIAFRFHARDLHLVLGPAAKAKELRFRVRLDGAAPGANHGADIDAQGEGKVKEYRLYQLIRLNNLSNLQDHLFEIEFADPNVLAFAFTFG